MANEIRLRANNISGTISDNPLLIGATTINSPGFVDLPTVGATNHLILILDPLEVNGQAEIVQVTTHAASSSVVTVIRGFDTTTPRQHPFGTTWFHGPVVSDYNFTDIGALSTNRPASPTVGQIIYETDTDTYSARSAGPVWQSALPMGAWTTWSPTLTNLTLGSGSVVARYHKVGRRVSIIFRFTLGAGSAVGTNPRFTLPFTPSATAHVTDSWLGGALLTDAGTNLFGGFAEWDGANVNVLLRAWGSAGAVINFVAIDAATPFAWGSGDFMSTSFTYESAS